MIEFVKEQKVIVDKTVVIGHTEGEYYFCGFNEFVVDGVIYKKHLKNILMDSCIFYCPVCKKYIEGSSYLTEIFKEDIKALWLSQMVTHLRHINHKTLTKSSYDKTWGRGGYGRIKLSSDEHDTQKLKQNEIEKRRLVKDNRFLSFLKENNFNSEDINKLKNTTEETINVWKNKLR